MGIGPCSLEHNRKVCLCQGGIPGDSRDGFLSLLCLHLHTEFHWSASIGFLDLFGGGSGYCLVCSAQCPLPAQEHRVSPEARGARQAPAGTSSTQQQEHGGSAVGGGGSGEQTPLAALAVIRDCPQAPLVARGGERQCWRHLFSGGAPPTCRQWSLCDFAPFPIFLVQSQWSPFLRGPYSFSGPRSMLTLQNNRASVWLRGHVPVTLLPMAPGGFMRQCPQGPQTHQEAWGGGGSGCWLVCSARCPLWSTPLSPPLLPSFALVAP